MSIKRTLSDWFRRWFGSPGGRYETVLDILRHRYADEKQHVARFKHHAQKMQYPQFRDTLLRIASEEAKHADWIAEKIADLGGRLPAVAERPPVEAINSWRYLRDDLEEERHCAAEIEEELLVIK